MFTSAATWLRTRAGFRSRRSATCEPMSTPTIAPARESAPTLVPRPLSASVSHIHVRVSGAVNAAGALVVTLVLVPIVTAVLLTLWLLRSTRGSGGND